MMKKQLFILTALFILATGIVGCDKEEKKETPNPLVGTKWKLVGYTINGEKMLRLLEPQDCEKCYTITFETNSSFIGYGSINELFGEYRINSTSGTVNISNLGGTKIGEVSGAEYFYTNVIKEVERFILFDGELRLFYGENNCLFFKQI